MVDGAAPPSTRPLLDLVESRGLNSPPREEINVSWRRSNNAGLDPQHHHVPWIDEVTLKRCFSGPHDPLLTNS